MCTTFEITVFGAYLEKTFSEFNGISQFCCSSLNCRKFRMLRMFRTLQIIQDRYQLHRAHYALSWRATTLGPRLLSVI